MRLSLLLAFAFAASPATTASAPLDAGGDLSDVGEIIIESANELFEIIPRDNIPVTGLMCVDPSLSDVSPSEADAVLKAAIKENDPDLSELKGVIAEVKDREHTASLPSVDSELFNRMGLAIVDEPMNGDVFEGTICTSVIRPRAPVISGEYAVIGISFTYKGMAGGFSVPFILKKGKNGWFVAVRGEGFALVS